MILVPVLLICLCIGSILFWTLYNGIGPTPISPTARKAFLQILPDQVEGEIIDAGSGWGTLAFALADKYPNNSVIGYENSLLPFLVSWIANRLFRKRNLKFVFGNFWKNSFEEAGLVVCYLYSGAMRDLGEKCHHELKSGSWVASHTFRIPDWQPVKQKQVTDLYCSQCFLYEIY